MTVKIVAEVQVYEFCGQIVASGEEVRPVRVRSHLVDSDRVVLAVGDDEYTVAAVDLHLAIRRCCDLDE